MSCWLWKLVAPVSRAWHAMARPEERPDIRPDIIELGMPFTDPIADGPTIQKANTVRRCPRPQATSNKAELWLTGAYRLLSSTE